MKIHLLGIWREYGWSINSSSIHDDITSYKSKQYTPSKDQISYLEKGVPIAGFRMVVKCVFRNSFIGVPKAYTDGAFIWTNEYLHYVKEGTIELPEIFLTHMENNNFHTLERKDLKEGLELSLRKKIVNI